MNIEVIISMLKELKLMGMAESFSELMNLPIQMRPSLDVCVAKMIESEKTTRNNALTEKLLKNAKLRFLPHIEDIECSIS